MCGIQVNTLDCTTGIPQTDAPNTTLSCAVTDYARTAVLTDGRLDRDPSGRAEKFAARRVIDPRVDYWEYEFTLNSAYDARLMAQIGHVDLLLDEATSLIVEGVKDRDWVGDEALDGCCVDAGTPCNNDEVSMLLWAIAWCGEERHPDFLYEVHVVPRLKFRVTDDTIERGTGFRTMTVKARTRYPNAAWAQGPGDIWPHTDGLLTQHGTFLTNTPFPNGCDCGACIGN